MLFHCYKKRSYEPSINFILTFQILKQATLLYESMFSKHLFLPNTFLWLFLVITINHVLTLMSYQPNDVSWKNTQLFIDFFKMSNFTLNDSNIRVNKIFTTKLYIKTFCY